MYSVPVTARQDPCSLPVTFMLRSTWVPVTGRPRSVWPSSTFSGAVEGEFTLGRTRPTVRRPAPELSVRLVAGCPVWESTMRLCKATWRPLAPLPLSSAACPPPTGSCAAKCLACATCLRPPLPSCDKAARRAMANPRPLDCSSRTASGAAFACWLSTSRRKESGLRLIIGVVSKA